MKSCKYSDRDRESKERYQVEYQADYIQILIKSLQKKIETLDFISSVNMEQKKLAEEESFDLEAFEKTLAKKQEGIDALNKLDEGFETVFERVKPEITQNAANHKAEIEQLKKLVAIVTEKGIIAQTEEARNKALIEKQFSSLKKEIRQKKMTKNITNNYYKNMNKLNVIDSVFMDKKK